jgi:membrane protein YdbS with pleckstrin-like domain
MEVLTLRYSWKNIIGYLIFAAILLIIIGIASDKQPIGAFIPLALIVVFIGLISTTLRRLSDLYTITKDFVTWRNGIISKNVIEIQIKDIRNINIKQGPMQRILKIGHIQIATAGTSGYEVIIKGINNPYHIKSLIKQKPVAT